MKTLLITAFFLLSTNLMAATYKNCPTLPVDSDDKAAPGIDLNVHWFKDGKPAGSYWTQGDAKMFKLIDLKYYILKHHGKTKATIPFSDQGKTIIPGIKLLKCELINGVKTMIDKQSETDFVKITQFKDNCALVEFYKDNIITSNWELCP